MKKNYLFLLCILFLSLTGCSKNDDESSTNGEDKVTDYEVKKWIRDKMSDYYLWNDKMPAESSINGSLSVEDYFYQLTYRNNKAVSRRDDTYGDRFSLIKNLATTNTRNQKAIVNDFGGGLTAIRTDKKGSLIVQFTYISPDSPLANNELIKRGTIFNKINGIQLTESNFNDLLNLSSITISNDYKGSQPLAPTTIIRTPYPGTPILYSNILPIGNHRVGYLIYNEFKRGPDDDDFENTVFEQDLKAVFNEFKSQHVDKLVLDLRYNPGGYLVTAQLLASLIAPENALGNVLAYHKYNPKVEKNQSLKNALGGGTDYFLSKASVPANLNLNNVCIITTSGTASASEFILNCLKPYMNVIQVGETTVGKNQSAITYKREPQRDWEISPIISYVENSQHSGGYEAGITPDESNICSEYKMVFDKGEWYIDDITLHELGDIEHELMLRQALRALGLNVPAARALRSKGASDVRIPQSSIIKIQNENKVEGLIRVIE